VLWRPFLSGQRRESPKKMIESPFFSVTVAEAGSSWAEATLDKRTFHETATTTIGTIREMDMASSCDWCKPIRSGLGGAKSNPGQV
jgi:hypothetical protein